MEKLEANIFLIEKTYYTDKKCLLTGSIQLVYPLHIQSNVIVVLLGEKAELKDLLNRLVQD